MLLPITLTMIAAVVAIDCSDYHTVYLPCNSAIVTMIVNAVQRRAACILQLVAGPGKGVMKRCINPSAHVSVTGRLIFGIFRTLMCEIASEIRFAPNLPPRLWLWTRLGARPQTPLIRVDNYYF